MKISGSDILIGIGVLIAIPLIGLALKWVIVGIGIALGIAIPAITSGVAVTGLSTIFTPILLGSLAVSGTLLTISISVNAFKEAKRQPENIILPILAVFSGLLMDICKEEFGADTPFERILYGGCVAIVYLLGGVLWQQKILPDRFYMLRILAVICFFIPPFLACLSYCSGHNCSLDQLITSSGKGVWLILGLGAISICTFLTSTLLQKPPDSISKRYYR